MAAPAKLSPRAIAGRLIQAVAIAAFVGLCAITVHELAYPPQFGGSETAQAGARNGSRLALPVRLALYGAGLVLVWAFGRSLRDPARFGHAALNQARFKHIVEAEHEALRTAFAEPGPDFSYPRLSDDELCGVYDSIDRKVAPERFAALMSEIQRRSLAPPTTAEPEPDP